MNKKHFRISSVEALPACYRDGEKPIPRHIWLACLGWESTRPRDNNQLPARIPSAQEYAAMHG